LGRGLSQTAPPCSRTPPLPYRAKRQNLVSSVVNARQQIKTAVNNTPSQIAAKASDQHRLNIDVSSRRDTERADEGEDHDQAEQCFGDPFHRIKYVKGST